MGIYDRHAAWYDALYDASGRDPAVDVATLLEIVAREGVTPNSWLDVACGTGRHAAAFRERVDDVVGVDRSDEMLAVARDRGADVEFVRGDFRHLDLGRSFDVVTCLFSSIGHVADEGELRQAVAAMARHVAPGGVLLVEAWLTPDTVDRDGRRDVVTVPVDDGYVVRLGRSAIDGGALVVEFAWAVATSELIETEVERHRMPLFTGAQYVAAVEAAGLVPAWHAPGPLLTGRPLLVGRRA